MEIYIGSNPFSVDQSKASDLEKILSKTLALQINKALNESETSLSDFLKDAHSCIFAQGDSFILCWIRDLCGSRMIILGSSFKKEELLGSDLFLLLKSVSRTKKCDLIQWLVNREQFEDLQWRLPSNSFSTNLAFETVLNKKNSGENALDEAWSVVQFNDRRFKELPSDIEYWVRWVYPGSTFSTLDTMRSVREEYDFYPILQEKGVANGICLKRCPMDAYVIWIQNEKLKTALIAMIWINPGLRGEVSGDTMLETALRHLESQGYDKVRYFVSAQNISAMTMLKRAGFQLTRYAINQFL
jgi:RimJ/RimL family protein N-acetyltransferase